MSKELLKEKRKITPAAAVKMLKESGREVTEKEAENILDFMYFLAKLIVNQNFKKWK